jgi:hypothetical protein
VRVAWAILCRHAEPLPDRSYVLVGAPTDLVLFKALPDEVALFLVVKLAFPHHEAGTEHDIAIAVAGIDMQPITEPVAVRVVAQLAAHHEPGWEGENVYHLRVPVAARDFGPHSVDIRIDGGEPYSLPFVVRPF